MDFVPVVGCRAWRGGSLATGLNQMDSNKMHIILQGKKPQQHKINFCTLTLDDRVAFQINDVYCKKQFM
jgi:hypothetical protein